MKPNGHTDDTAQTQVYEGSCMSKSSLRVNSYGNIDEVSSQIGMAICLANEKPIYRGISNVLADIQNILFEVNTDLAGFMVSQEFLVNEAHVAWVEDKIVVYTEELPKLTQFIVPGGTKLSAQLHICRTTVRRAERLVIDLMAQEETNEQVLTFITRLSDLMFTLARQANYLSGEGDVFYRRYDQ